MGPRQGRVDVHDLCRRLPRDVEASRNHILRYQGVDIDPVNWGWLCDKGRFDFEAIESDERLSEPLIRKPAMTESGPADRRNMGGGARRGGRSDREG